MLSGERIESGKCDINDARENAEYLAAGDNTKLGMDEESFCTVLATDGFEQLRRVFDEYQKLSKQTMHQGIRYSMSGGIVRAMLAIGKNEKKFQPICVSDAFVTICSGIH